MKGWALILLLFNFEFVFARPSVNQVPTWVTQFPKDSEAYIGIGKASKKAYPNNYREQAQLSALTQMSREISIQIHSENKIITLETNSNRSEQFSQQLSSSTTHHLIGYQLEDIYETDFEFYALYTLNKEKYSQNQAEEKTRLSEWLRKENDSIDQQLKRRELEQALNRYAEVKEKFQIFQHDHELPNSCIDSVENIFQMLSQKLLRIVTNIQFSNSIAKLKLAVTLDENNFLPDINLVSFNDPNSKEKWKGRFQLSLVSNSNSHDDSCQIETDSEGNLKLKQLLNQCKVSSGGWAIHGSMLEIKKVIQMNLAIEPVEINVNVVETYPNASKRPNNEIKSIIEQELKNYSSENIVFTSTHASAEKIVLEIHEINMDSLGDIFFAQVSGVIKSDQKQNSIAVTGKAGHQNKERAIHSTLKDLIRSMEKKLLASSHYEVISAQSP